MLNIIGFSGTQFGMTLKQQGEVMRWLNRLRKLNPDNALHVHHGMCIGADEQFHRQCTALGFHVHGHPCTLSKKQMKYKPAEFATIATVKAPLERNEDIVLVSEMMLIAPKERREEQRSGTWATYRRAALAGKAALMLWP